MEFYSGKKETQFLFPHFKILQGVDYVKRLCYFDILPITLVVDQTVFCSPETSVFV